MYGIVLSAVLPDDPAAGWTTPGTIEVASGLGRIPLPLPQDGLRAVNIYATATGWCWSTRGGPSPWPVTCWKVP